MFFFIWYLKFNMRHAIIISFYFVKQKNHFVEQINIKLLYLSTLKFKLTMALQYNINFMLCR